MLSFPFPHFACQSWSCASCDMLLGNRHHHWSLPSCCHHCCHCYCCCSIFIMKSCHCYHHCCCDHYCCCCCIATGAKSSHHVVVLNCCHIVMLLPSSSLLSFFSLSRACDHCHCICFLGGWIPIMPLLLLSCDEGCWWVLCTNADFGEVVDILKNYWLEGVLFLSMCIALLKGVCWNIDGLWCEHAQCYFWQFLLSSHFLYFTYFIYLSWYFYYC